MWNDLEDEESDEDVTDAQVVAQGGGGYGGAAGHGGGLIAAKCFSCDEGSHIHRPYEQHCDHKKYLKTIV